MFGEFNHLSKKKSNRSFSAPIVLQLVQFTWYGIWDLLLSWLLALSILGLIRTGHLQFIITKSAYESDSDSD